MPNSGFFGLVWRFNALAIALAASGAVVALGLLFVTFAAGYVRQWRVDQETELVERGRATPSSVTYRLGNAEVAEGTPLVIHTLDRVLASPRAIPIKSAYNYDRDVVNLLVVDDAKASGRWMFDGVGQAIFGRTFIHDPATLNSAKGARRSIALMLEMSATDTNKDGVVDGRDETVLVVYRFSDGARRDLLKGSLSIISMRQTEDGNILVMYEEGKKTVLASFAADDFRALATNEVPRLSTEAAGVVK